MKANDYICFDHEECFRIKYTQFKRGLDFTIGFHQMGPKANITLSCVICQTSDFTKWIPYKLYPSKTKCNERGQNQQEKKVGSQKTIIFPLSRDEKRDNFQQKN